MTNMRIIAGRALRLSVSCRLPNRSRRIAHAHLQQQIRPPDSLTLLPQALTLSFSEGIETHLAA
jgi:methionine-rich copper-binding protein CopC